MSLLTRRDLLLGSAAAVGALAARPSRAAAAYRDFEGEIRILGIGYDDLPAIRERALRDLGFRIVYMAEFETEVESPGSPGAGVVRHPLDVRTGTSSGTGRPATCSPSRSPGSGGGGDITPLYKLGRARPRTRCAYGQGDAAFRRLYLDPDRSGRWRSASRVPAQVERLFVQWVDESSGKPVGPEPRFCTGVPGTFNFDSFGYRADILRKRPEELSWAELLNRRWRGRVALISDPQVGLQDTANAVQAAGLMRFGDLGDPTRREIDSLVKLLLRYRKQGQFFNVWSRDTDPINWMKAGQVVVASLFALQIASLAALKVPVRQAAPREGYRAFARPALHLERR